MIPGRQLRLQKFSQTLAALLIIVVACALPPPAQSQLQSGGITQDATDPTCPNPFDTLDGPRPLRECDRQIFLKLIDLIRFNIIFRQTVNQHWKAREWIYPLAQEIGTGLNLSGSLSDLIERSQSYYHPERITPSVQKGSIELTIIGESISGASSAAELAENLIVALAARRRGYSPPASVAHVQRALCEVDSLLDQRDKLTAQLDPTQCDLNAITLEGKIMRHIRNQALHEFIMFSVRSREQEWTENSFFALNATQHGCAVAANIAALKAFSNRTYTPGAAIANIVASSIGVVNPLSRPFIGQAISRYWHWRLTKLLPEDRPTPRRIQDLIKEWKEFEQLGTTDVHKIIHEIANNADIESSELREVAELVRNTARQDSYLLRDDAELRKLRRVAAEQAITGPATNLASLARQICTEVAYSGYRHEPVINNRINIAGRISQISGQTWQLIATPAAVVRRVQFERKLKETNQLPSQVLTKRLKQLADLEQEARELSF